MSRSSARSTADSRTSCSRIPVTSSVDIAPRGAREVRMTHSIFSLTDRSGAELLCRGCVAGRDANDELLVDLEMGEVTERLACDVLVTNDAATLQLAPDDEVLVWTMPGTGRGVVIGRIGRPARP